MDLRLTVSVREVPNMKFKRSTKPSMSEVDTDLKPVEEPPAGVGVSVTLILGVLLTLAVIILAVQNTEQAEFEFLVWDTSTPLVVILLSAVLAGVVFDEIAGIWWRRRRRLQLAEKGELEARRAASRQAQPAPEPVASESDRPVAQRTEPAPNEANGRAEVFDAWYPTVDAPTKDLTVLDT